MICTSNSGGTGFGNRSNNTTTSSNMIIQLKNLSCIVINDTTITNKSRRTMTMKRLQQQQSMTIIRLEQ
jgi:hypothetical protein